jgi:hypothetical protein
MAQANSSSRSMVLAIVGALALAGGLYMQFGTSAVSSADQQRCEKIILDTYGNSEEAKNALLPKCNEPGMVAMMDAKANNSSAASAAQSIASANQSDIGSNALSFGLIGAGIGLLLGGVGTLLRRKK